jgi:hypothetical protein
LNRLIVKETAYDKLLLAKWIITFIFLCFNTFFLS